MARLLGAAVGKDGSALRRGSRNQNDTSQMVMSVPLARATCIAISELLPLQSYRLMLVCCARSTGC